MAIDFGPRTSKVLSSWVDVVRAHPNGPGYDLTTPTRSERFWIRLKTFIEDPTESNFRTLWSGESLAAATAWHAPTVLNLWSDSLTDLSAFFEEIRSADQYAPDWERRVSWGTVILDLYTRPTADQPIVSREALNGLQKLGIEPATGFEARREHLSMFCDRYLDVVGHLTVAVFFIGRTYEEVINPKMKEER